MANDLVRWSSGDDDGDDVRHESDTQDDNEQWDTPPDRPRQAGPTFSASRRRQEESAAEVADRDARDLRLRGDPANAVVRETDAAEHRQKRLDWGDFRTWAVIAAMCVGFLLFCAFVYVMPQGRHNQSDGSNPTPPIRVY